MRFLAGMCALLILVAASANSAMAAKPTIGVGAAAGATLKHKGTSNMTTGDCIHAGGTVVTPPDDRCGKLYATYCRMPDTTALCIEAR